MDIIDRIYESNKSFVENPNFKGVKKIIVDNYSDEAHFIYEMLQNADDAEATEISFELFVDKLIVTHNGNAFSDKDLESICSINKGTKVDDYTKIGKFGIGFKSVFVYTESPQIFSGKYSFEIRELVLPRKLDKISGIDLSKTVFILPFNAKKTQNIAYERIKKKLDVLYEEAIIFLKNIKIIKTIIDDDEEILKKIIKERYDFYENTKSEYLSITKYKGDDDPEDIKNQSLNYYLFKHEGITLFDSDDEDNPVEVKEQSVMVAFREQDGIQLLNEYNNNYYVFFPTRIQANCKFLVHAPFVTKSSRDTIALNHEANEELMRNIGILVADSMLLLASKRLLSINLIESLFFEKSEIGFGNEIIFNSFKNEYTKLIQSGKPIIPCDDGINREIQSVLFTEEDEDDCKKLYNLVGMKYLSAFYSLNDATELCHINKSVNFFNFVSKSFGAKKLVISDIIFSLKASYLEEHSAEWFTELVGLFVKKGYYGGWRVSYSGLEQLPLIRTKYGKHLAIAQTPDIYLNNGTLDESILEDSKVEYLYRDVFKIREYSTELSDAKAAIKYLSSSAEIDFDNQVSLLRKILIAIQNKKLSNDDYLYEPIIMVINQKTSVSRKISPGKALVGKWERTNGSFDLYTLCKGVDIELIDSRYLNSFTVSELKQLGCKTDGFNFSVKRDCFMDFFSCNGRDDEGWHVKYLRPLVGRANNRLFQPLYQMDNFEQILKSPMTIEKSVLILRLAKEFDNQIKDWVEWSSRADFNSFAAKYQGFAECYSLFGASLVLTAWMYDNDGMIVRPGEVTIDNLAQDYRKVMTADIAEKLGLKRSDTEKIESLNQKLESDGLFAIPLAEREMYEEFKRQQKMRKQDAESWNSDKLYSINNKENTSITSSDSAIKVSDEESIEITENFAFNNYKQPSKNVVKQDSDDEVFELVDDFVTENESDIEERKALNNVLTNLARRTKKKTSSCEDSLPEDDEESDEDEYMPSSVNRKIERAMEKSATEIKKITGIEKLKRIAEKENRNNKYSYKWFTTLLEMEGMSSDDSYSRSREISISFARVEREPGTKRTLLLKHPSRFIPQFMEDLADISMVLHMGDQTKKVAIEVANVQQYTLRVKMQNEDAVDGIDLNTVTSATIDAQSPAFLLEELKKQFEGLKEELGYDDDFNMQKNLRENIEFVFGPPGTGKTTHLAKNVLIPMMKDNPECKVLVLTPTNKAADVLVRRIMEVSDSDQSYNDWLVRFGATGDEEIEQSPVYKDKNFDIKAHAKNVTVTTIARFPYDYFIAPDKRIHLYALNWDYIVIDEASMIPIANIVLPLYKKTPKKFIIAGDPFQIEPIATVDLWKDENIYKMVKLESFSEPTTIPHDYKVELLTTQYRSVPDIGSVFSKFAYGGILKHHRAPDSQRTFKVGDRLKIKTFNIVKFPVSKYESIYRCKRLKHSSSYQVYSALFTFEYACYLAKAIAENNPEESFKIGIIAPYRAQADMIDKLFASEKLPKTVDVQVGTIHGFQGDECDIIFAVFNTPPTISKSKEMFLNKMNIINVSISRARDYLFVIMPDENTENISNLELVNRVEYLIKSTNSWQETLSPDLEELMFGDSKYLENNAFSTSHQSVNVYGLPEKCYEVRTEDAAIDVQIHRNPSGNDDELLTQENAADGIKKVDNNDSYNLKESVIPVELRDAAIDITVKGAIKGWFYLVPFEGKLKEYTTKKTTEMFVHLMKDGKGKKISVYVIEEDRLLFISDFMFEKYEKELSGMEGIELIRKS